MSLISSSLAGLYFPSFIIISPFSIPACMLEPLYFNPTHPSWSPMLEHSINPWILSRPDQHICHNWLHPALDLAVALAKFLSVCTFPCEGTCPHALVNTPVPQPLWRHMSPSPCEGTCPRALVKAHVPKPL